MIHTPKVSFACHRECYFDRTYIQQRKERCERDFRCFACSRSSSPWCPQLILSHSILQRPNVYEEEKNRHRESKRDSKTEIETRRIPRATHSLTLEMYTRAEKERDLIETRREQKAYLERQSRVFPQRTTTNSLFYI